MSVLTFLLSLLWQNLENPFKLVIFETEVLALHTAESVGKAELLNWFL